ncbi:hypothetical protein EUX98_g5402 [Antrodiella citrinella]|uniref:ER transporter 6TM N-terminal domain-containing protein n=1 Tax=Antrodiella citrinella TaxID=2447956 RepID=A0A4S4MUE1_9APHY|nr:hypothetical protein EUX98_g5402 [Antrodiella citrinella]
MGDEDEDVTVQGHSETSPTAHASRRKEVTLILPSESLSSAPSSDSDTKKEKPAEKESAWMLKPVVHFIYDRLLPDVAWVPNNWTWTKVKPVIRGAVLAFVSLIFVIVFRLEKTLGNASFLTVTAAFLDPPIGSFIEVLEREIILVAFVSLGWAWNCLGIFLASKARSQIISTPSQSLVLTGHFLEAGPTVILFVFIFIGCFFFLYWKARLGPGQFTAATVFGAICVDITMLTAALFPFPNYNIGKVIVLPLCIHAALAIVLAAVIFPTTTTSQYTVAMNSVLTPLTQILDLYRDVLKMDPSSTKFASTASAIHGLSEKAEAGLAGTGAASRLLKRDILWGRFSPIDFGDLGSLLRPLVVRTNGMGVYFAIIDPTREKFPMTPAPSQPPTPSMSRTPTRPSSPVDHIPESGGDTVKRRRRPIEHAPSPLRQSLTGQLTSRSSKDSDNEKKERPETDWQHAFARHFHHHKHGDSHHAAQHNNHLHFSLLHFAHSLSSNHGGHSSIHLPKPAVGVFESQRYVALEATRLGYGTSAETTALFVHLLQESCDELLQQCQVSMKATNEWVSKARSGGFRVRAKTEAERKERLENLGKAGAALKVALENFRTDKRLRILDPYRPALDPQHVDFPGHGDPPIHKFLFHCYVFQYHFMRFSMFLSEMMDKIIKLEKERPNARLWLPTIDLRHYVSASNLDESPANQQTDDENPDVVQGIDPFGEFEDGDLGPSSRRDPDALPPDNVFQLLMSWIHRGYVEFFSGNSLFALKAALLTIILSLPSVMKSSAAFAYGEKFVWAVSVDLLLTLARWRGDTTFGLVSRIVATFFGCLVGMALWYISTGTGTGNPYGLAAVVGVASPFLVFARLYWPGPPMTNVVFFVTITLIIGYSWQNTHIPIGFNYWGWPLAWRRFILVTAGVVAAFIFSFLPPSTTLRGYQRRMMSTTVAEIGSSYCAIVSYANTKDHKQGERVQILQTLLAIRLKLKRSHVMKTNIVYEFSLRGKWPAERYKKILDLQLKIAFLLSHLMSTIELLEPAWARACLKRTRLLDSDFQGDILAVISLISTSLRTGQPLPQITPCPLLDRFMKHTHGLNIIRQEADDDYGLPRTMTIATLANEQYMYFSVGVTTAFGIVMRLDRLMMATKELVGEQYHIRGIGLDYRPTKDA